MALDFDPRRGLFRVADTSEITENANSMEDGIYDYLVSGTIGAVASAGVGFYNTAYALGEALGVADGSSRADTFDFLNEYVSEDVANFYSRHSAGVDIAGLVAGSLVPGLGAVRAVRLAQTKGILPAAAQAATGLRNPDLVLGSKTVEAAKQAVLRGGTLSGFKNPAMYRAYALGGKQQLLETVAFEAGMLATMNQHATLNPEGLGYFESTWKAGVEGLPFLALGVGLGAGIDVLRIRGAVKSFVADEYARTGQYLVLDIGDLRGMPAGDKVTNLLREQVRRNEMMKEIGDGDWFANRQWRNGQKQLQQHLKQAIGEMNFADTAGRKAMEELIQTADANNLEHIASVLAGATKLESITPTDLSNLSRFYQKTSAPSFIISGDAAGQRQAILDYAKNTRSRLRAMIGDEAADRIIPSDIAALDGAVFLLENTRAGGGVRGAAWNTGGSGDPVQLYFDARSRISFPVYDRGVFINEDIIENALSTSNEVRALLNLPAQSKEEFVRAILYHELGHVKNNPSDLVQWAQNTLTDPAMDGIKHSISRELVQLSYRSRPEAWGGRLSALKNSSFISKLSPRVRTAFQQLDPRNEKQVVDFINDAVFRADSDIFLYDPGMRYLMMPQEMLADAAAYMTNPTTAQIGSKIAPTFAHHLNASGAIARAWDDTQAFYNRRTRQTYSSYLPGLVDTDSGVKYGVVKGKVTATSSKLRRSFTHNPDLLKREALVDTSKKIDFLVADANWAMVANTKLTQFLNKQGELRISGNNLPLMEKLLTAINAGDAEAQRLMQNGKVFLELPGSAPMGASPDLLRRTLMDAKIRGRDDLALTGLYNEHEIAKILNIDVDTAIGKNSSEGWLLYGTKSFTEPEVISMRYKPMDMADAEASTKSLVAVDTRQQMLEHQAAQASAEVLGKLYNSLPEVDIHGIQAINPLESRTTLINNARTAFGSFREKMAYVGKLVNQAIINKRQDVAKTFQKYNATFNHQNAGAIRHELANIDQVLRREWYYLATTESGERLVVQKKALAQHARQLAERSGADADEVFSLISDPAFRFGDEELLPLVGVGSRHSPDAIKLSREVGELFETHRAQNASIVDRKKTIANAIGKDPALDRNVLYPPPRDLRRNSYVAFVTPNEFTAGADPRKFMIFAETSAEFEAKVQAIQNKYGKQYNIVTRKDVELHKQYMGDYEKGLAFDEINFDASLHRSGDASELIPNQDIQISGTLERYQTYHVNQETALIRAGVELRYGKEFQALRSIDDVMTNAERSRISPRYKEKDSIWKDTVGLALDQRSYGGFIEDIYTRVNDFIGERGSALIDDALGIFRSGDAPITQAQLDEFNMRLESRGYQAPLSDVMEAALASPDPQVSRALPSLVRTLNNLASAFMLRMDFAHSIIQLISTPILALPVISEAKQALRGTAAGQRLEEMTTVLNPANGTREPSTLKLFTNATKKFFSQDGKDFLAQLRERNIVSDYLNQYLEAIDFSQINGRHTMKVVNDKIDALARFGSKWSGFSHSEEFTRFQVAHSVWEIGKLRGIPESELWATVSSAVDKVHGVYLGNQRPQLFQGVVGQAIGLYQTYFFNFAQNFLKYLGDGDKKQLLAMGALQSSIFGLQSWPGFQTFNRLIGETNRENTDVYSATGANDPDGWGKYFMYGLGSHILGVPIDFYTRGDLAIRNALVVPTNPMDIPALQIAAKAVSNAWNTGTMAAAAMSDGDFQQAGQALLHGLAHNGLNRPSQGIAQIVRNRITSGQGQVYFQNSNYIDYDMANELNWGAMFARVLGTRPLNESIIMNEYFRQSAYENSARKKAADIGKEIQFMAATGNYDADSVREFAQKYNRAGGDPQNFSAYWMRQMQQSRGGVMTEFRRQQQLDDSLRRHINSMRHRQSLEAPWQSSSPVPASPYQQEQEQQRQAQEQVGVGIL